MCQLSVWPFPPRLVFSICLSLPTDLVMALDLTSLMQSSQSVHHELRHHKTKPNKERELTFFSINNRICLVLALLDMELDKLNENRDCVCCLETGQNEIKISDVSLGLIPHEELRGTKFQNQGSKFKLHIIFPVSGCLLIVLVYKESNIYIYNSLLHY